MQLTYKRATQDGIRYDMTSARYTISSISMWEPRGEYETKKRLGDMNVGEWQTNNQSETYYKQTSYFTT